MQTPRVDDLPQDLRDATRAVATRLGQAGHRAWLVGGAVRDLALGRPVHDADLVSDALPHEVEALFPRTVPVGAAFGIVIVVHGTLEVEVATFREERGYSDGRHPDEVLFSKDAAVDAARRDFTCNALYLDPLDGTLFDPLGGLADLAAGRLAAVGDARQRFLEDGLRLMRMARFQAALGLEPAPGLHDAARAALSALVGVSPERVLDELGKVLKGPRAGAAIRVLDACGIADAVIPGYSAADAPWRASRLRVLDGHGAVPGIDGGLTVGLTALLQGPEAGRCAGTTGEGDTAGEDAALGLLQARCAALRPSRATLNGALEVARLAAAMAALAAPDARRATRLRALRSPWFEAALDLAWRRAAASPDAAARARLPALATLRTWCADAGDPCPAPLLTAADLIAAGLQPGPRFGALLNAAEDLQLDGDLRDRGAALEWLRAQPE
ncbi:MAG: CCA tRNA nucleotidyltransferase [Planctomycetota bacterium]